MDFNSLTKAKFRPESIEEIRARLRTTNELIDVVVRKSAEPITKGLFRKTYTRKNNLQGQVRESWNVCFRELLQEGAKLKVFLDAAENNINVIDRTLLKDAKEFVKQFVKLGERPGCAPFNRLLKEAKNSKWSNLLSIDKSKRGLEYYVLLAGTKALKLSSSERDALEGRAREAVPMVGAPAGARGAVVAPADYVPEGSTVSFYRGSKVPLKAQTVPLAERVAAAEEAARLAAGEDGEENTGAGLGDVPPVVNTSANTLRRAAEKAGYKPLSGRKEAWANNAPPADTPPEGSEWLSARRTRRTSANKARIAARAAAAAEAAAAEEVSLPGTVINGNVKKGNEAAPAPSVAPAAPKLPPPKGSVPRSGLVALARAVDSAPPMSPAAASLQARLNALRGGPSNKGPPKVSDEERALNAELANLNLNSLANTNSGNIRAQLRAHYAQHRANMKRYREEWQAWIANGKKGPMPLLPPPPQPYEPILQERRPLRSRVVGTPLIGQPPMLGGARRKTHRRNSRR
jgi:hypothetical protein